MRHTITDNEVVARIAQAFGIERNLNGYTATVEKDTITAHICIKDQSRAASLTAYANGKKILREVNWGTGDYRCTILDRASEQVTRTNSQLVTKETAPQMELTGDAARAARNRIYRIADITTRTLHKIGIN